MIAKSITAAIIALALLAAPATAGDYERVVPLIEATKTVVGETVAYPTTGAAKVTSMIVAMEPGESTGPHRHGAPTWGYILEGQVTVDYGAHGKRTYRKGDAFMEAEQVTHDGLNDGDVPVQILVVFMGAEGTANVIHEK